MSANSPREDTASYIRKRTLELIGLDPGIRDRDIAAQVYGPGSPGMMVQETCRDLAEEGLTRRKLRPDGLLGTWIT